jgi:hypothetical protein
MTACAVVGCAYPVVTVARIGLAMRPTGAETYQLMPMAVHLCRKHRDIISPAGELYLYSMEWESR